MIPTEGSRILYIKADSPEHLALKLSAFTGIHRVIDINYREHINNNYDREYGAYVMYTPMADDDDLVKDETQAYLELKEKEEQKVNEYKTLLGEIPRESGLYVED